MSTPNGQHGYEGINKMCNPHFGAISDLVESLVACARSQDEVERRIIASVPQGDILDWASSNAELGQGKLGREVIALTEDEVSDLHVIEWSAVVDIRICEIVYKSFNHNPFIAIKAIHRAEECYIEPPKWAKEFLQKTCGELLSIESSTATAVWTALGMNVPGGRSLRGQAKRQYRDIILMLGLYVVSALPSKQEGGKRTVEETFVDVSEYLTVKRSLVESAYKNKNKTIGSYAKEIGLPSRLRTISPNELLAIGSILCGSLWDNNPADIDFSILSAMISRKQPELTPEHLKKITDKIKAGILGWPSS